MRENHRAQFRQRLVASHVIRMHVRVNHEANRLIGNGLDRRQQLIAHLLVLIVDNQHSFVARQHAHLAARARHHHDLALHQPSHFRILRRIDSAHAVIGQRR